MRTLTFLFLLLVPIFLVSGFWFGSNSKNNNPEDRVLLKYGQVLTFEHGKKTNARRVSAIPQLNCVGGSARHERGKYPSVVQCTAIGTDSYDMQWKCEAILDKSVRFGRTDVVCEGYHNSEDEYVLRGSCGLEYVLDSTTASSGKSFMGIIMFIILAYVLYSVARQCGRRHAEAQAGTNYANLQSPETQNSGTYPPYAPGTYPNADPSAAYTGAYLPGYSAVPQPGAYPPVDPSGAYPYGTYPPGSYNPGYNPQADQPIPSVNPSVPILDRNDIGFWSALVGGGLLAYYFYPRYPVDPINGLQTHQPSRWSNFNHGFWEGLKNSGNHRSSSSYRSYRSSSSSRRSSGTGGTRRR